MSYPTFDQLAAGLEYAAPLFLAVILVWLGFWFQRWTLDRERRRVSYVRLFRTLSEYTEVVRTKEELTCYQHCLLFYGTKHQKKSGDGVGKPTLVEVKNVLRYRDLIFAMARREGIRLDLDAVIGGNAAPEDVDRNFRQVSEELYFRLLREGERLRQSFWVDHFDAQTACRVGLLIHVQSQIDTLNLTGNHMNRLVAIGHALGSPKDPYKIDWAKLGDCLKEVQSSMLTDLGSKTSLLGGGIEHQREPLPWPKEVDAKPFPPFPRVVISAPKLRFSFRDPPMTSSPPSSK